MSTTKFKVGVPVTDAGAVDDPHLSINDGLSTLGDVLAANTALFISLSYQIAADGLTTSRTKRPFFWAITLEASSGNDYYWSQDENTWKDYGGNFAANYYDAGHANFARTSGADVIPMQVDDLPSNFRTTGVDIPSTPTAGQVRISLYNVVETQDLSPEEVTAIFYFGLTVDVLDGEDAEAGSTQTLVVDNSSAISRRRQPWTFYVGDGPTDNHTGRVTYNSGTRATGWKGAGYATSEASTEDTLDHLHAEQILAARHRPLERLALTFRVDSGDFWPHVPLKYASTRYSSTYIKHDVARCEYDIEAVELYTGSYTPTEQNDLNPYTPIPGEAGGGATVRIPVYRDHIYMEAVDGSLDDVDDGSTYGRVLATSISAGQIILAQVSGDLDDVTDGTTSVKWNASGVPPSATNVGSAGLYMGTDKMGYYDGSEWRTYMDSSGNLNLVDDDGASTFNIYVAGAPNVHAFSIEAATALNGFVILSSGDDAKQMKLLSEDAGIVLYGTNSFFAYGGPRIDFECPILRGQVIEGDGADEAVSNALSLSNTTAATVGTDQFSPAMYWVGQGWKTDATAASQEVGFRAYVETITGTANPSGVWHLQAGINGAGYSDLLTVGTSQYAIFANAINVPAWNATAVSTLSIASVGTSIGASEILHLVNPTAAAAGAQQFSPALRWGGQGWKTDATAESQAVSFQSYVQTVQGSAAPSGTWHLQASIDGGAYSDILTATSAGTVATTTLSASGDVLGDALYTNRYLYHNGDADTYLEFGTNTLTLSAGANAAFSLTSSNIGITTSMSARTITPQTDDTYDLGSATYYWNNCFLTNVDVDTLSAKDGSTIVVNANLSDDIGGLYSLGASGTRWLKTWTGALDANGTVTFGGLPTSSGGAAGTLWNDSGTIKIN